MKSRWRNIHLLALSLYLAVGQSNPLLAQQLEIIQLEIKQLDSLLSPGRTQIQKIDALDSIMGLLYRTDSTKAFWINQRAAALSHEIGYQEGLARAYKEMGVFYDYYFNFKKAREYFEAALIEYQGLDQVDKVADVHNGLGLIYDVEGNYPKAIAHYSAARELFESLGDTAKQSAVLINIGVIHEETGAYLEAIDLYHRALRITDPIQYPHRVAGIYSNIGLIHSIQRHDQKAIEIQQKAYAIRERIGDTLGLAISASNLGDIYVRIGELDSALRFFRLQVQLSRQIKEQNQLGYAYRGLGDVFLKLDNADSAIHYYRQSLAIRQAIGQKREIAESLLSIGQVHHHLSEYQQALSYFEKADSVARLIKSPETNKEVASKFQQTYLSMGNFKLAHRYSVLEAQLAEELYALQKRSEYTQLINQQQLKYAKDSLETERNNERTSYEQQLVHSQTRQWLLGLAFALSLALLGLLFTFNHKNTKTNQELKKLNQELAEQKELIQQHKDELSIRNQKLEEIDHEKNLLVGTIAHDLKSPLNQMFGLLELVKAIDQDHLSKDSVECIDMVEQSIERLKKLISRVLDFSSIDANQVNISINPIEIRPILDKVVSGFSMAASNKSIHLIISQPAVGMVMADEDYLSLTLENLVSNALKFSKPGTQVTIGTLDAGENWGIYVQDQGPGISTQDQQQLFVKFQTLTARPTADEDSTGLGLVIAKRYMTAMGGDIRCESELGQGAKFIIELPKYA